MAVSGNYENSLIAYDPIVARNFFLEIKGFERLILQGVSGLEVELDVVSVSQNGQKGMQQHIKTLGGQLKVNDITVTRMAPANAKTDPMWKWFLDLRNKGMQGGRASTMRKDGAINMYDSAWAPVGSFAFYKAWPSKIATDAMSTEGNEPMKETITLVVERVERTL